MTTGRLSFFAPPGTLKSWLALHLCVCVATGTPFLGHFSVRQRSHAIYINLDAGANAFSRRLTRVSPPDNLLIVNASQYDHAEFENVFRSYPGAFVAVDCLAEMPAVFRCAGRTAATLHAGISASYALFTNATAQTVSLWIILIDPGTAPLITTAASKRKRRCGRCGWPRLSTILRACRALRSNAGNSVRRKVSSPSSPQSIFVRRFCDSSFEAASAK